MPGFCGVAEHVAAEGSNRLCRWPNDLTVTWAVSQYLPGMDRVAQDRLLEEAFDTWAAVCGFRHERISNAGQANIRIETANLGSGGVLAQAQLPCGGEISANTRLWTQMNSNRSLRWSPELHPPRGMVPYYPVALHEIGHNLGIGHETTPHVRAIMEPNITELRELQRWDIQQGVLRYGARATPPPIIPTPPEDDRFDEELVAVGRKDGELHWYLGGKRV